MASDGGEVGWSWKIEWSIKVADTGGVVSARIVVMLAKYYKTVAIPDWGWYSTNS